MQHTPLLVICSMFCAMLSPAALAQNLVPNPSFEEMTPCDVFTPELICAVGWSEHLGLDPNNTPDLGYEGAVFFPPSTIEAFDGDQYLNIECSTGNPEYAQITLLAPLVAGTDYCVSFYASVTQESLEVAPSLGAYFGHTPMLDSPFEQNLNAHVQGSFDFDPTTWTLITGTYTATGGELYLTLGGFENTGTMPWPYMYIDQVSVIAMPSLQLADVSLCDGAVELNAFAPEALYNWSTGENTFSINVTEPGVYSVLRTLATCTQTDEVLVTPCNTDSTDVTNPTDTLDNPIDSLSSTSTIEQEIQFFIPNAFTPNGDGNNDVFYVVGPSTDQFELQIYNRWGEVIFASTDIHARWTGNHQGGTHYAQDGIYVYRMRAIEGIEIIEKEGHIVLIR